MDKTDDILGLGGGGDTSLPATPSVTAKTTATALPQESEEAKRTKRRRASLLTKNFGDPVLGESELFGLGSGTRL